MKFAFHSEATQDVLELREKILNANFTYTLTTDFDKPDNSFFKVGAKFSTEVKPVVTTRGLCYAINAKNMNEVFAKSKYLENFEEAFGTSRQDHLLNGHQSIGIDIDMGTKYLTDRNGTSGFFW